ncbi:hypothetical protein C2E23DRAFT_945107 [Lenzites betulinus]|nr:hypothetical protein C2E23DRAFT_945107 [Lenzites betulinus]
MDGVVPPRMVNTRRKSAAPPKSGAVREVHAARALRELTCIISVPRLPLHALDSPGRYRSVHEATKSPGRAEPNARNSNVQVDGLRIRVPPCSGGRLLGATGGWRSAAPGEGWRWDVLKRSAPSTRRTPAGSCTSGEPMWGSRMDKRGSAACAQRFGRDRKVGRRGVRDTTTCGPPAAKHTNSGVKSSYGAGAADPPPSSRGQRTGAQGEHGDERGVPWRAA